MTREEKIKEVERLKQASDIASLVSLLRDDDDWVRYAARRALVHIGRPAIPEIERALQDEDEGVRCRACEALGELGDAEAVPALTQVALEDPDNLVRELACGALGEIGDSSAIPALLRAKEDRAWNVRVVAGWALDQIRRKTRLDNIPRMIKKGDVAALVEILEDDEEYVDVHIAAIQALGELANPNAVPALVKAMQGPNEFIMVAAARALGRIADPSAVPALIQALKHPNPIWHPRRAEVSIDALVQMGRQAIPTLVQLLEDEDNWTREAVCQALGAIGHPDAVPALIQAMNDADGWVRRAACEALGAIGDPSAIPETMQMLDDPRGIVRQAAREALNRMQLTAADQS